MFEAIIATVIGGLILAAILYGINCWWVSHNQKEIFKVCFVNQPPPGEIEISKWGPHSIRPGSSQHYLRVRSNEALKIERFNVRFIDLDEVARDPYEPLIDLQHFIAITGISIAPRNLAHGIEQNSIPDDKGGFDVLLKPPMNVAAGESFVLEISVKVYALSWDGKISFRGHDSDGNRRYGRKDVRVSESDST
jgi:hypothetical protein